MSMSKKLSSCAMLALALMSAGAHAGTTQANLVINKLQPEGNGILIGFTTLPTDCATSYKGGHAFLGTSVKDFDSLYLILSTAMVTGSPVTITYADNGDCSSAAQLLSLSTVTTN
jgi:hypothetical protein